MDKSTAQKKTQPMTSYLGLIPASAKAHRRQNRMTLICIVISVLLVTTVFSMADMMIRTESGFILEKHGSWHIKAEGLAPTAAEEIGRRPDVTALGWSAAFNTEGEAPWHIGDKKAALCGADETYILELTSGLEEGTFPKDDGQVMLSLNAKSALGASLGDSVTLHTPKGDRSYTVSGFGSDDREYYQGQTYLVGVCMTRDAFEAIMEINGEAADPVCYIQFQDAAAAAQAMDQLNAQYALPSGCLSENVAVMGISGSSNSEAMKNVYGTAAVLFVLVLLAGVLMISGSMNSNVAQRTQFFGLLRCIGASRRQVMRFVRLEALSWCRTAVPIGLLLGTIISWGVCALLHYGIGGEFDTTPVFAISPVGLISGAIVGVATVLLAAQSPAARAARVSPATAISGNSGGTDSAGHGAGLGQGRIQWALGIRHATGARKNWALMTASFALSIVMLLCFSVGMELARALLPSLRSWQPDLSLNGYGNAMILDRELADQIGSLPGVKQVYGVTYIDSVPATSSRSGIDHISLVSYDDYMLECAGESLAQGDVAGVGGESDRVLTIYNRDNPLRVGDKLRLGGEELEVAGALSDGLFSSDLTAICSQETFDRLMGKAKYSMICVQLGEGAPEETVTAIGNMAGDDIIFSDAREYNRETVATYWATRVVGYGFLLVIGMIAVFNIINSISMSVAARTKQYGAMRAVGMDGGQLTGMIAAEALTYALSGLAVGFGLGLPLSRALYTRLVTHYFGLPWVFPTALAAVTALFVFAAAGAAVYAPSRRILRMAVTETISEL